jgi:hypothetical protein
MKQGPDAGFSLRKRPVSASEMKHSFTFTLIENVSHSVYKQIIHFPSAAPFETALHSSGEQSGFSIGEVFAECLLRQKNMLDMAAEHRVNPSASFWSFARSAPTQFPIPCSKDISPPGDCSGKTSKTWKLPTARTGQMMNSVNVNSGIARSKILLQKPYIIAIIFIKLRRCIMRSMNSVEMPE